MDRKVAVVTGASSGIGRSTAELFADKGFVVAAVARDEQALIDLRTQNARPEDIHVFAADLADPASPDRLAALVKDQLGRTDVLVNAAGIIGNGSISTTSLEDWDSMLNINLRSIFVLMQKFLPLLQETRGNIVNVSSVTGTRAFPNVLAYCVSKAGVDQLTRCAALELAPNGIRVNAVNPGVVVTNLHKRGGMAEDAYEKFVENSANTHPLGRAGRPEEVAQLIYFLASEHAEWITGATYAIDGGRSQTCAR